MSTTSDPEGILLDAYVSQRCAVRLQNSFDSTLRSLPRRPRTEADQRRIDAGLAHEERILTRLAEVLGSSLVRIENRNRTDAQDATSSALEQGAGVIADAWLPPDREGHRVGRPDLLIRSDNGYVPVEIKLHLLTNPGRGSLECSSLDDPSPDRAFAVPERRLRKGTTWFNDALQLVHYRRMLEALGIPVHPSVLGGVIDGSGSLWWIPLDATIPHSGITVVKAYDERFAELVSLAATSIEWDLDRTLPRPRQPWWHKECERCPYEEVCHDELAATDDVSLVRWMSEPTLSTLKAHGVATRTQLAALDLEVIDLAGTLSDTTLPLPALVAEIEGHDPDTLLVEIVGPRLGVRRRLDAARMITVGDLENRDATSLALAGSIRDLGRLVRRARAFVAGGILRTVAADEVDAKRADVEVDVDMESYEHATYLWGALVTPRPGLEIEGVPTGYKAFVTFDPLDDEAETELFAQFWEWMMAIRTAVRAQGRTFRAFCFWRAAEEGQMRRALRSEREDLPKERQLQRFFNSPEWVDLHELAAAQVLTEGPLGLKVLAHRAGFEWRDDDPSGEASIAWYEEAIGENPASARARLLAYNEDDVRATRALRDWLDGPVRQLPHLNDPLDGLSRS